MLIYGAIPTFMGWQSASSGSSAVEAEKRRIGWVTLCDKAIAAVAA